MNSVWNAIVHLGMLHTSVCWAQKHEVEVFQGMKAKSRKAQIIKNPVCEDKEWSMEDQGWG